MLGVGLSQIRSTNTLEIAFFVIVAFRSLMTYATLVSSITSLTSALSKIKEDETSEFRLLRSYMAYNNIGAELSHKVSRFLQHQYHLRQEAKSAHANVPLLDLLSPTLRRELEFARNSGSMEKLDFISGLLSCELNQSFFFLEDFVKVTEIMTDYQKNSSQQTHLMILQSKKSCQRMAFQRIYLSYCL